MKTVSQLLSLFLLATTPSLVAAPATELPHEWAAPHETDSGYSLIDRATGQIRTFTVSASGSVTQTNLQESDLSEVSGVVSGYDNSGGEKVVLSSKTADEIVFSSISGATISRYNPPQKGPVAAVPLQGPSDGPGLLIHAAYPAQGEGLSFVDSPHGSPTVGLTSDNLPDLEHLQPVLNPDSSARQGIATHQLSGVTSLYEVTRTSSSNWTGTVKNPITAGSHLATTITGTDGRGLTLAFVFGSNALQIFTHDFAGFANNLANTTAPFPIGSISALPASVPNALPGVLLTSVDGLIAAYAHVINGNQITIQQTFTASGTDAFTGLIAVPNRGIIQLLGDASDRVTTDWRYLAHNGTNFGVVSTGALSSPLPSNDDFATLFWYDAPPFVSPIANLVKLERLPDWTSGGGSLPASLAQENYLSSITGLGNSSPITPATPNGATYVLTNQIQDNVSLSSLASNSSLLSPSLAIAPASGTYSNSLTITANYERTSYALYVREEGPGATWTLYQDAITVGYPSEWAFHLRNLATGEDGPITTRSYDFSVPLNELDSDNDGVPDYVERAYGLDPNGGADSDLDFQSDLEEILAGTDPNDADSQTAEALRNPPFIGTGFFLSAQAYNPAGEFASPANDNGTPTDDNDDFTGEEIQAHTMQGSFLTRANVEEISGSSLNGQYGAFIDGGTSLSEREWLVLSSPLYFELGIDPATAKRDGRETYRVLQRPVVPTLADGNTFVPSGDDLAADAAGWLAGITASAASHTPTSALTRLDPEDNAIAILAEKSVHESLLALSSSLSAADYAALNIPADSSDFTLFEERVADSLRSGLTDEMTTVLQAAGYDFNALLSYLDTGARASAAIVNVSDAIYARHATVSDSNPLMALPLDALRSLLLTGAIEDPNAEVAATFNPDGSVATTITRSNPYATIPASLLATAKGNFDTLLAGIGDTKRPVETWTVVIESPSTLGHRYNYRRMSNSNLAWFIDGAGERFTFEAGLGLNLGTLFTISGFVDTSPITGFDTMEITSIDLVVTPTATDNDQNGNLLDDEWERFFFGGLGVNGPNEPHPTTGHPYLQYYITGADPRAADLTVPIASLIPSDVEIVWQSDFNAFDIEFDFPDAYVDSFQFQLASSTELTGFSGPMQLGGLTSLGMNRHSLRITTADSTLPKKFFQIQYSLSPQ